MKKILCIGIGIMFLLSCGVDEPKPRISQKEIKSFVVYYKDERTNICFARIKDSRMVVNCTPEVERIIQGK